jgi:glycosyltransferase involved in cell wall biosynthesis
VKILHLLADWKWTGPAEPVLDLCLILRELGLDARLAANAPPPEASTSLLASARDRGLDLVTDFRFGRIPWPSQVRRLRDYIDREGIDLVHVHMTHDHLLGGRAARRAKRRPPVVRTNERAAPTKAHAASRFLFRRYCDGYLTCSQEALEADRAAFGLEGRAWKIPPGMRLDRFDPSTPPARGALGVADDAFVVGVVARMQRHRRFDVLLEGIRRADVPGLRVLVVGRGTHMNEVAVEPAKRMGLDPVVTFTGYRKDDYLNVVSSFDALLFLVPGSDGTCRAIREAMAMGKPVIGARRGMIPELVENGTTGLVIDDTAQNIAAAIGRLAGDRGAAREMGERGRARALERFDIRRQAEHVRGIYESMRT